MNRGYLNQSASNSRLLDGKQSQATAVQNKVPRERRIHGVGTDISTKKRIQSRMALPFACHEFTSKVARETPKSAIVGTCFRGLIVVLI